MAQPKIKYGKPQPIPCEKCGMAGYGFSDQIKKYYSTTFKPDGEYEGGFYSDHETVLNAGKTAFCADCGKSLKFKIERDEEGEIWSHGYEKRKVHYKETV